MAKKPTKVTVVEATGAASSARNSATAATIEAAMTAETIKCFDEGISDPDIIRERKLKAREAAKAALKS